VREIEFFIGGNLYDYDRLKWKAYRQMGIGILLAAPTLLAVLVFLAKSTVGTPVMNIAYIAYQYVIVRSLWPIVPEYDSVSAFVWLTVIGVLALGSWSLGAGFRNLLRLWSTSEVYGRHPVINVNFINGNYGEAAAFAVGGVLAFVLDVLAEVVAGVINKIFLG
jgi:hypothetical protein